MPWQAERWALRLASDRKEKPIVNVYTLDSDMVRLRYRCLVFKEYDSDWLDFIVSSRSQRIGCISTEIARRLGISNTKALGLFYSSRTSERFHDESTGLYLYGDLYIVDEFMLERTSVTA